MLRHIWTCHLISYTCGSFPTSFSVSKGTRLHFQYHITFFRTVYCINVLITACLRATSVVVCGWKVKNEISVLSMRFYCTELLKSVLTWNLFSQKIIMFIYRIIPRFTTLGTC